VNPLHAGGRTGVTLVVHVNAWVFSIAQFAECPNMSIWLPLL
jgi:hypothetical protein